MKPVFNLEKTRVVELIMWHSIFKLFTKSGLSVTKFNIFIVTI